MQNGNFSRTLTPSSGKSVDFDFSITPEWVLLICDIILQVEENIRSNKLKTIDLIKKLKRNTNNPELQIIKQLIRVFYILIDSPTPSTGGIIYNITDVGDNDWQKINDIDLNPQVLRKLFGELFGEFPTRSGKDSFQLLQFGIVKMNFNPNLNEIKNYLSLGEVIVSELQGKYSPSDETMMTYNFDKFISKMYEDNDDDDSKSNFWDIWDESTNSAKRYFRDSNGDIYSIENGEKKIFNTESIRTDLKKEDNCKFAGIEKEQNGDSVDKLMCSKYIQECLLGKNITQCRKYLIEPSTRFEMVSEVKNMNPQQIIHFTKALKITPVNSVVDGKTIKVLPSTDEWLSERQSSGDFSPSDVQNIRSNKSLIRFLDLIQSLTKTEPAILNPDYVKNSSLKQEIRKDVFKGTTLHRFGLHPNYPSSYSYPTLSLSMSSIEQLANLIRANQTHMLGLIKSGKFSILQSGGGGITNLRDLAEESDVKLTYPLFKDYYSKLTDMLESKGKQIAKKDNELIEEQLKNLEKSERTLKRVLRFISEYVSLLDSFGEQPNVKNLKIDYLKQFVEERDPKILRVIKKQDDMTDIIRSIMASVV
jgi:hypothetical protein